MCALKIETSNELALQAASLRRKKMTVAAIARFMVTSERQVNRHLRRAEHLYRQLAKTPDSEKHLGETLTVFLEMEREALSKFAFMNPAHPVAVAYLNAARDARKEIKKLLQEAGMIVKVPQQVYVTGLNLENDKVLDATLDLVKLDREERKNNPEDPK